MLRSETGVVQDKQGWSGAAVQRGSKTQLPRPLLRRGEGAGEARARGFEVGGWWVQGPSSLTSSTWWRSPGRGQGKDFGEAHEHLGVTLHIDFQSRL